jgi:hypothetical protein
MKANCASETCEDALTEINDSCVLMRTLISRVLTGIYDEELRPVATKNLIRLAQRHE